MKIHHSVAMFLAGTCLSAGAAQAQAEAQQGAPDVNSAQQQAADEAGIDQTAIIVTAQKRPQILLDVPQSVSVISGEKLEQQHAQRLSDYLTKIPSANIVESQAGQSRIVLRGINTGGVGATVATYIDEAPFGSATSLANGA
ncbi:MAG TPA: TonB-dependent receptor plug domain-containing protein, partial [Sphingomicrobium sp.]|nr:TonB-dependent receptor plug domain-containing protein [Sphingomicrobium sp.]